MEEQKIIGEIGSPVKDFIIDFFSQLKDGLDSQGLVLCSESQAHTILELNAISTGETSKGGGVRIWNVLSGDVKKSDSDTNAQKIKVFVKNKSLVDEEEIKARIEKAKVEQRLATQLAYDRAKAGK